MPQYTVTPLQKDLSFGVRVSGLTLEQAQDDTVKNHLNNLFIEHGMIVFEDVESTDEMQLAISHCFGPLKEHPIKGVSRVDADRLPGVVEISTRPDNGGVVEVDGNQVAHWLPWHFDHCYNDELNRAGVLRALKIVEKGGVTGFLDGIALYKLFPEELLAKIEGRDIVYALSTQYDQLKFGRPERYRMIKPKPVAAALNEQVAELPRAIHPAVWTRDSGEKVLHVSQYMAEGILGQENAEGDALLEEVCQTINRLAPTCSYHHRWRPTDMLIWDNHRMLHAVSGSDPAETRIMYRTTIKGDYDKGRWDSHNVYGDPVSPPAR
ncbi:MAG TPA: TauD/TfdA family dioxygenase [Pseudomonadaceae bacterium]|nr:TauD/TfdA family dioxygenase [Pseudomonadaceae bacterium]